MDTIYLNHAGTSWPKPPKVQQAVVKSMEQSVSAWDEDFVRAHGRVASFFGLANSESLLLTPGGTSAIATAISDIDVQPGDKILTTHFEHHSVYRSLQRLTRMGVELEFLPYSSTSIVDEKRLDQIFDQSNIGFVALTSACNVTGDMVPVDGLIRRCRERNVPLMVDASQTVGWFDLDLAKLGADIVAFAAHKGLQAPWGIGGLYLGEEIRMTTPTSQCQLPQSGVEATCTQRPGYCDVGSVNRVAFEGLASACDWLSEASQSDRLSNARSITIQLEKELGRLSHVRVVALRPPEDRLPTVAFVVDGTSHQEIQTQFKRSGIVGSIGFQCSPLAHQALGTNDTGVIRLSVGPGQDDSVIGRVIEAVSEAT